MYVLMRTNLVEEEIKNVWRVGSSNTENCNNNKYFLKTCLHKLTYKYYINLVKAIIRHQTLYLTKNFVVFTWHVKVTENY